MGNIQYKCVSLNRNSIAALTTWRRCACLEHTIKRRNKKKCVFEM